MEKPLIRTEGKTDEMHLRMALKVLQTQGKFIDLDIDFFEVQDNSPAGYKELIALCRTASQTKQHRPQICIFDHDLPEEDAKKVANRDQPYKDWGNHIYSFIIPIPMHRPNARVVSIEHYYKNVDLMQADNNGKRLFLGDEFSQTTGVHKDKKNLVCKQFNEIRNGTVIDNGVFEIDSEHDVALSKSKFAENLEHLLVRGQAVDVSAFELIFSIIEQIVQGQLEQKTLDPILTQFKWEEYLEEMKRYAFVDLDPVRPDYYEPIDIFEGTKQVHAEDYLLNAIHGSVPLRCLIFGQPGSGKTYLLERICAKLADDMLVEVSTFKLSNVLNQEAKFVPSQKAIIPLLFRLNLFNHSSADIEKSIVDNRLISFGLTTTLVEFLKTGVKFVLLFDDLDEVWAQNFDDNLNHIQNFVNRLGRIPHVSVIIAGRQTATQRFRHLYRTYRVCNLSKDAVISLLNQLANQSDIWTNRELTPDKLISRFDQYSGLLEFLSTPYFVRRMAEYWNDFPTGNIAHLIHNVIFGIIDRQEKTEHSQILLIRRFQLEMLAFECLETNGEIKSRQLKDFDHEIIYWFQHMGFVTHSTVMNFTNQWMLAYLAARYAYEQNISLDAMVKKAISFELVRKCTTMYRYITAMSRQEE